MSNELITRESDGGAVAVTQRFPLYSISSKGNVVSRVFKKPRQLRPISFGSYKGLTLLNANGKLERIYLHRLVAMAFLGDPPSNTECRHLDGNKENNCASNLSWGTRSQNMRDKEKHGTAPVGEKHGGSKLREDQITTIRLMKESGIRTSELINHFKVSRAQICRIVKGTMWSHL